MVSSHTDDTQQLHEMILISSLYLTRITLVHQQQGMTKEEILEGRDTHQQQLHFKQSNQSVFDSDCPFIFEGINRESIMIL